MEVPLFKIAPYFIVLAACKDDSMPNIPISSWIKKGKLYKVKHFADALNTSNTAVTITDDKDQEIHPNESTFAFRSERFDFINIGLN